MHSAEDREREPFRWCVFCDVDCDADQDHAADCPSETGLWPVVAHKHCETCSCDGTILCAECDAPLRVGDFYVLRDPETGQVVTRPEVGVAICIGCGTREESP